MNDKETLMVVWALVSAGHRVPMSAQETSVPYFLTQSASQKV
jgi:hypothetical protein